MERFLNAYLLLAWVLCISVAVALRRHGNEHGWPVVPALVIFALGWPVVLPVVAVVLWRKEASRPPA